MEGKFQTAIGAVQNTLRAVETGRGILRYWRLLPRGRKKAAEAVRKKAVRQAERAEKRVRRQARERLAMRRAKGIGRIVWAIWERYF